MPNAEYRVDTDDGFLGFDSRTNPAILKPQMLQYAENVRLVRGEIQKRKGLERIDDNALTDSNGIPLKIRTSCQYVTPNGDEKIALACSTNLIVYFPSQDIYEIHQYPTGRTIEDGDSCMMLQALDSIYIFRGLPEALKECTLSNHVEPHTTVVADCIAHGYSVGDEIIIADIDPANPIEDYFTTTAIVATVPSANVFTYTIPTPPSNHQNRNAVVQRAKPALVWSGQGNLTVVPQGNNIGLTANMPPTDNAIYFGNRVIVKTDRNNIAVSDFLDFNTFDLTFGQFTINQGANDYIVGMTPWADDEFLIFQRNSIYIGRVINANYITGEGASDTSYIKTVTNSFGAVARRTIVNTGRMVFFLSDSGIFALEPTFDLRLINTLEPISAPVDDIIKQINEELVENAVATYFDNRLFFAVPVGPDSTGNNKVLIYNILNKNWESVDTFFEGFNIQDFLLCLKDKRKRLFATSTQPPAPEAEEQDDVSGFCLYEENEDGDENTEYGIPRLPKAFEDLGLIEGEQTYGFYLNGDQKSYYNVKSIIRSRKMNMKTAQEKRFSAVQIDAKFITAGEFETTVRIFNPDQTAIVDRAFSSVANDITRRVGIARRGFAAEIEIVSDTGRPIIRGISLDATTASRSNKSTQ